jgi:arginine deiminase
VGHTRGVDSEAGQLRTVLVHRPGLELQRMTARHRERLLLRTLPWVSRARQEHDLFCQALRDQGVEVLYLTELLQEALEYQAATDEAICLAVADAGLGDELRGQLRAHLEGLGPEALAQVLIAGLTPNELKLGRGVVFELLDRHDFVLDPLPNLIFTRDSSLWIGDRVAVASPAAERRRREAGLAGLVYRNHPRFAGTKWLYRPELEHLDGADVLLLAPGVIAVGVGDRTTPAGTERLARHLFDAGLAHCVLAVPMSQQGAAGYLDTVCAVVDHDAVVMHPAAAYSLTAHAITARPDGMRVSRPQPFLEAAAQAMGIERLRVIDAGAEPGGCRDQFDDGGNVLAVSPRLAVCHERNSLTNARLEEAGIQVIRVPSSELGSLRGGPRCMSCSISRDPAAAPDDQLSRGGREDMSRTMFRETLVPAGVDEVTGPMPAWREPRVPAVAAVVGQRADDGHGKTEELASASLEWRALSVAAASRPTADPEDTQREGYHEDDHADQEQPHNEVDHYEGYPDNNDRCCDQHQEAKHKYTVRATGGSCQHGVARIRGGGLLAVGADGMPLSIDLTDSAALIRLETVH